MKTVKKTKNNKKVTYKKTSSARVNIRGALLGAVFSLLLIVTAAVAVGAISRKTDSFNKGIISFTFVDGYDAQFKFAKERLKPYDIGASFYVATNDIGKKDKLGSRELRDLNKNGFEIGNMTSDNTTLMGLSKSQIYNRYKQAQSWFKTNLDIDPKTCLYPKGPYSNTVSEIPSEMIEAVSDSRLGFDGCMLKGGKAMFQHDYSRWRVQSLTVDENVNFAMLTNIFNNVAGGRYWVNLRIVQIDERVDADEALTTSEVLNPAISYLVGIVRQGGLYVDGIEGALEFAQE